MALSEDKQAELKAKYGKLYELSMGEDEDRRTIVVRVPTRMEWKRFKQQSRDESKQDAAPINLLKSVLLDPDPATLDAWINILPGLEDSFASGVLRLMGATENPEKKAL